MQTTVFDFTFKLRDRPREIYIRPAYNVIMSAGFRIVRMGQVPKSFKLTVGISDGVDERSLDEVYGDAPFRKYNRAIHGYLGIVRLGEKGSTTYQPKFLLGPSRYPKVMVGRIYDHRGFLKTFDASILKGLQAKRIIDFSLKPLRGGVNRTLSARIKTIYADTRLGIISTALTASVSTGGRMNRVGQSKFYGIIENKNPKILRYSERVPLFKSLRIVANFSFITSTRNFEKLQMAIPIHLTFENNTVDIIPSFTMKYVILSINKNIIDVPAERSVPSRMNVNT